MPASILHTFSSNVSNNEQHYAKSIYIDGKLIVPVRRISNKDVVVDEK